MEIIEQGRGYEAWTNEDRSEVLIDRSPTVQRESLHKVMGIMSNGAWIAHGLEEREDGGLRERWVKHA